MLLSITNNNTLNLNNKLITKKDNEINEHLKSDKIATLIIPKIKLKKDLYSINSNLNNVNKNVFIVKPSDMPNIKNGNLILAAHSGNSKIAFFKHLNKLNINDIATVYFNDKDYIYKLVDIYKVNKTGYIEINRNNNKTVLTLITCDKKDKSKQIVYIFELIN